MDLSQVPHAAAVRYAESQIGLPEYIKDASAPPDDALCDQMSDQCFLNPQDRVGPIFNKAAAWLSAVAYLSGTRTADLDARLMKAAAVQEITEDVEKLIGVFESATKSASVAQHEPLYALRIDFEGQEGRGVENFYPINNYGEVLGSSAALMKDASERGLPLELVREAALNIHKAAREYGVNTRELHRTVEILGQERLPDVDHAVEIAETRKWAGVADEGIALYKEAAEAARGGSDEDVEDAISCWLELDKIHGVKYARHILDPYQAFYSGETLEAVQKTASEVVVINDVLIPKAVFGLPSEKQLRQNFSKESAERLIGLQKEASTNPAICSASLARDFTHEERHELLQLLVSCAD